MRSGILLALAFTGTRLWCADTYPDYNDQSIVNAATQTVEALAPNTIATLYGRNLAFSTRAAETRDLSGGTLPTSLDGVTVYVNGLLSNLFYISPGQINFLIPYELVPGTVTIIVARQGAAGPAVKVQLMSTSPGLFMVGDSYALAVHLDGRVVQAGAPARAGEIIVALAAGLGWTSPATTSGRLAPGAAAVVSSTQVRVMLDGVPVPAENILYAGLAPGFAGLYQVNFRLPNALAENPEIRLAAGNQTSPESIRLAAQGTEMAEN